MQAISGFALFILLTIIVFFVANTDPVTVSFIITEQSVSLALVIIISTLSGFLLGLIVPRLFRTEVEHYEIPGNENEEVK